MRLVHLAAVPLLALGLVLATPRNDGKDRRTLPPAPQAAFAKLGEAQTGLAAAVQAAEKETGGRALSAAVDLERMLATVELYTKESALRVEVALADGSVGARSEIPRFPGVAVRGEPQKTASGLLYYELAEGSGRSPDGPTTKVRVHYSGWLLDGTKFDSSYDRGEPAIFALNQVIAGWTEGVGAMKVGGKRKLIVPPELGWGDKAFGPIPPNSTTVFDVELIEVL